MRQMTINKEPVELYKLLKFEALADSGGQAKAFVAEGLVKLNGTIETRKRKKVVSGDQIEFDGTVYSVTYQADD